MIYVIGGICTKQDFPSGEWQFPRGSWSIHGGMGYHDNSVSKKAISA